MNNTTQVLPPYSKETEEALLGSLLIDSSCYYDILGVIQNSDVFYFKKHQWLYEAITAVSEKYSDLDILQVANELRRHNQLEEVGGESFLIGLFNAVPTSVHAISYAYEVLEYHERRKLIRAASNVATLAYDLSLPIEDVITQSEDTVFGVSQQTKANDVETMKDSMYRLYEYINGRIESREQGNGIQTGFIDLDRLMGGLEGGWLILLAARPGMGKSSMEQAISLNVAKKQQKTVARFNLEMSSEQLGMRLVAMDAGIDLQKLRAGQIYEHEKHLFCKKVDELSKLSIYNCCASSLTISELRSKCRKIKARHGLDLVTVDYLQLMGAERNSTNRVQEVGQISRGLKMLAIDLNVPVIALSQLNRSVESRADKHPQLSDLRETGDLENDADAVIFIYRDDYYYPDTTERPGIAEINVAKFRHGPIGLADLQWTGRYTRFGNLGREEIRL